MIQAIPFTIVAGLLAASPALADSWKDESGKRGWRGDAPHEFSDWRDRGRKLKYRTADGCEVERKWKNGEYKEKVKCKGR